jgi:hypothetical protein
MYPARPQGALIVPGTGVRPDADGVGPLTPQRSRFGILAYIYRKPGTGKAAAATTIPPRSGYLDSGARGGPPVPIPD